MLYYSARATTALNLGSYNYLGYAENDGPCAHAAAHAIRTAGVASLSPRQGILLVLLKFFKVRILNLIIKM